MDPAHTLIATACSLSGISVAANLVIAERTAGLMGLREHEPGENARMVSEKIEAFFDSAIAVWMTACQGGSPDRMMFAALAPVSAKVRDNAHRLSRS